MIRIITFHIVTAMLFATKAIGAMAGNTQEKPTPNLMQSSERQDTLWTDTLKTVTIIGSNVTNYADRDMVRITKDMRRGARNSAQLIGRIQGFDCDIINNDLTYYGSKNILIVVDSVPKLPEYIKELHHMRFDKVEVIHTPSGKWAEYDVVINFHTRPTYEGYEGNISESGRILPNDGNGQGKNLSNNAIGGQFTWTKNKWNIVGRYDFTFNQGEYHEATRFTDYKSIGISERTVEPSTETQHGRRHNVYTAVDYQINKNHRVSLTYALRKSDNDNGLIQHIERSWAYPNRNALLHTTNTNENESSRHTLGLFYGGNINGWGLFYDFNYINNLNNNDYSFSQDNNFNIGNNFKDRMNYVWSNIGFNRRFGRYYLTASHSFIYKGYERENRMTDMLLSENTYYRNRMTIWMSYRFSPNTELTLGARLSHVHAKSLQGETHENTAAFSTTLFHKFNKKTWLRVNYWYDEVNPKLEQVSNQGYFTDSLHYQSGNHSLATSIVQRGRIWLNCFGMLGLQAGFNYAPDQFAKITYPYSITHQGIVNNYIAERTENTRYTEWWYAVNITKQLGDFNLNANVKYQTMSAKYGSDKTKNDGFSGYAKARHYHKPWKFTTELGYHYNTYYGVSPQGYSKREMDYFQLSVSKELLKDSRLSASLQYQPPIHFTRMKYSEITDCLPLHSQNIQGILKSNRHAIRFNLTYRFAGGKSVRKYSRTMSEEN